VASPSSDGADLPDDIANRMSLFYANPTLMLNTLSGATSKLLQEVQCVGVWVWVCIGGWWKHCYKRCSVGRYVGGGGRGELLWRGNVNVALSETRLDQYLNYSCLHFRAAKTQEFKVTSGMYSDMLGSLH